MSTIYICVEHDENPADHSVHCTFTDLELFLEEHNECMETTYSTIEEFNEGEEYRTIYASDLNRKTYVLHCHTEPMGDTLYGDTLENILKIFNEDYDTDYSTMEEFNEGEDEWVIYEVIFPNTP